MSSGGGISRFASRKQPSSNGETSTSAAPSEYNPIAETKPTKFTFGFNENSDTLSTASDDEFGFLGGGGNSIGGDDFFMMGGFDEVNGDYSATTTTEVSVEPQKCENFQIQQFVLTNAFIAALNRILLFKAVVLRYFAVAQSQCHQSLQ
jgi:hypothetical protein